jgi:hypothetical protein
LIGLIDDEPLLVAMSRSYSGPVSQEAVDAYRQLAAGRADQFDTVLGS